MGVIFKYLFRICLFIGFQAFVLDKVRLHEMLTPYLYFLFIIWLPFHMNRTLQMVVAFILGYALDSFRHHPGFHAAACVFIAYLRPFLINILIPQEGAETNYKEPSIQSMGGFIPYLIFISIISLLHNIWLFMLESWQFSDIFYFFTKTILSTALSIVLIIITELLFSRQQKFRTNTV
jgi:hypothetical protein